MRFHRTALFLAGLVIIGSSCSRAGDLEFTITFKDAKQLRPGQFLVYNGIQIGKVTAVDPDPSGTVRVDVTVDAKHRGLVYQQATFGIERVGSMDVLSVGRQITMEDSGSIRTPIRTGDVIRGREGSLGNAIDRAKSAAKAASEGAARSLEEATEETATSTAP